MEAQINIKELAEKLTKLQARVDKLQEEFEDTQLSAEDIEAIKLAEEEYERGETVTLEDIEKLREKNVSN